MNMNTAVFLHSISIFLALTGGVMLAVWLFKNLKAKDLLLVIILMILVGLLGSYLMLLGLESQMINQGGMMEMMQ